MSETFYDASNLSISNGFGRNRDRYYLEEYFTQLPKRDSYGQNGVIFSSEVDVPADATNPAFTITQPAGTVILNVGLVCTDSFTTGNADNGFDVGTSAEGKQICDGADAVNNDASAVAVGTVCSQVLLD